MKNFIFIFVVSNLRPNGEYEFRVLAKFDDGSISSPSPSSGYIQIQPYTAIVNSIIDQHLAIPGKPIVIEVDQSWARLHWDPPAGEDRLPPFAYLVEVKEVGDLKWYPVGPEPIVSNEFIGKRLVKQYNYCSRFKILQFVIFKK